MRDALVSVRDALTVLWGLIALIFLVIALPFALVTGAALLLRGVGVAVPCLVVGDPPAAARERVERDIAEHEAEAQLRCEEAGGEPPHCRAEVARRRDRVLSVEEDPEAEDEGFLIHTANGVRYEVSEQLLARHAVCAGMVIDSIDRPE
jgi:hypothetical protein